MGIQEKIIDENQKAKATRLSFGEGLAALGAEDSRIVALDADLSKSTRTDLFAAKFPDRFFNMGIAEANMIGVAAGLATAGKVPFAASFGAFLSGRFDQIRMSVSFSGANVRLVGTHAGVGIGEDGHSQMALEDLALMRSLPNMTVFQPADDWDTRQFMAWSLKHVGPCYMRLTRQNLPALKRPAGATFAPGRWDRLLEATASGGVALLATGGLVPIGIQAVEQVAAKMGEAKVGFYNANWIKPIDEKALLDIVASKPALIVTLEDHYSTGGLGGAVSEFLASRGAGVRLLRLGVEGFGQSGSPEDNYRHYGFTPEAVAKRIFESGIGV
jgi:transketolase